MSIVYIHVFVYVYMLVHDPYDLGTKKHKVFYNIFIIMRIEKKKGFCSLLLQVFLRIHLLTFS